MILPTKHLHPDRALISVASEVLELIKGRTAVSSVWNALQEKHISTLRYGDVPYDWFVLALDLLFLFGAIEEKGGFIQRTTSHDS